MSDARKVVLAMEDDVHAVVELSAVMGLCLGENRDEALSPEVLVGMKRLGWIIEDHAKSILLRWEELDAATGKDDPSPPSEGGDHG